MPDCLCFAFPRRDMMYDVCSVILAGMLAGPKFAINYAGFLPRLRFCVNVSAWVRPSCPRLWGLRTISINRITLLIATAAGAIMYCWVLLLVCLFVFNSVVVDAVLSVIGLLSGRTKIYGMFADTAEKPNSDGLEKYVRIPFWSLFFLISALQLN